jgi:hypothetical protein
MRSILRSSLGFNARMDDEKLMGLIFLGFLGALAVLMLGESFLI